MGITDDAQWLTVMRAIDKLDRLGVSGVQQLLGEGRKDESGDFTKGAGLSRADIVLIASIIEPVDDAEEKDAQIDIRLPDSKIGQEGRAELQEIRRLVAASGYGSDRIIVDPSVVRGLEYYTVPSASAPSAAVAVMTVSSRGFAASRCRPPDFPSACRGCRPRSRCSASSTPRRSSGLSSSPCSTAIASPITKKWSLPCAPPTFAPNYISAIPKTWATSSNILTGAIPRP